MPANFGARRLATRLADFEALCERLFGRPTRIEIRTEGDPTDVPPAAARPPEDSDLANRRRKDALKHHGINDALDVLGGEIVDIRPIS